MVLAEALWPGVEAGWVLFLGLSATFGALFALGLFAPLVFVLEGVEKALG
ncbi:hypothetical protein [Thermus sediminis]|nr:hypothetical protein [Thermus sediminis]